MNSALNTITVHARTVNLNRTRFNRLQTCVHGVQLILCYGDMWVGTIFFLMSLTFTWYPLYCTCALLNLSQVLRRHSSNSEHGEQKKLPGLSLGGNRLMFYWERVTWASQKLTVIGRNWTKVGTCVYECIDSTASM